MPSQVPIFLPGMSQPSSDERPTQRTAAFGPIPLLTAVMVWCGIAWFGWYRYQPPPVIPADGDPSLFSAERAEAFFQRLYEHATPHPAGQNTEFREQLVSEFEQLGYEVELHHCQSGSRNRRAPRDQLIDLTNLIVTRQGSTDKPPVMLAAHFDSHPDSPGAGDDGAGVCVLLEIARMLAGESQPERSIIFFVSDGEEFGMLGARKFVEEHVLSGQVAAVINLEARGTSGPSLMFETSDQSRWLVNLFAQCSRRPFTSSLFYEIYKTLPNDTDFTVFRDNGMQGMNFAFIGNVRHYHTPHDTFANVSRQSIQHHGEHALELVRRLANMDIERQPAGRAVYFDVMGYRVIRWPSELSIALAVLGGLLAFWLFRPGRENGATADKPSRAWRVAGIGLGLLCVLVSIALGGLLQFGLSLDGALDSPWPRWPVPLILAWWLLAITAMLGLTWWWSEQIRWQDVWLGVWGLWSTIAVVSSVLVNGASYLWIAPLLATGVCAALVAVVGRQRRGATAGLLVISSVSVAMVWLPMESLFYDAIGLNMNAFLILRVALASIGLLPVMAATGRRQLGVTFLVFLAAWVLAVLAAVVLN